MTAVGCDETSAPSVRGHGPVAEASANPVDAPVTVTPDANKSPVASAADFVATAEAAYAAGELDRGHAMLAAGLAAQPTDRAALELAEQQYARQLERAIESGDLTAADEAVTGYRYLLRRGYERSDSPAAVDALLAREETARGWEEQLKPLRDAPPPVTTARMDGGGTPDLSGWRDNISGIEEELKRGVSGATLDALAERAERLYADALIAKADQMEIGDVPDRAREVLTTITRQQISERTQDARDQADRFANDALARAEGRLKQARAVAAQASGHYAERVTPSADGIRWTSVGEHLV